MQYKCYSCNEVIDESKLKQRDDGSYEDYWGSKVWMPYLIDICPYCGSEDIEETDENEMEE